MIYACTGLKGGSGKSTVAVNLAAELLARGRRVLLVDGDPQGTARIWGRLGAGAGHPVPTIVHMGADMHRAGQLDTLARAYEDVVIDTPPALGDVARSALMVADVALFPCGPSPSDAWALAAGLDVLGKARAVRPHLRAAIVLTRVQARTALSRDTREALGETGLPVLEPGLGLRVAYPEAMGAGMGVTAYAPRDGAAVEVRALVTTIMGGKYGE